MLAFSISASVAAKFVNVAFVATRLSLARSKSPFKDTSPFRTKLFPVTVSVSPSLSILPLTNSTPSTEVNLSVISSSITAVVTFTSSASSSDIFLILCPLASISVSS